MTKLFAARLSRREFMNFRDKMSRLCGQVFEESVSLSEMIHAVIDNDCSIPTTENEPSFSEAQPQEIRLPRCVFSAPYSEKGQVWIWCDEPKLRISRKTNRVPLTACLQCETRRLRETPAFKSQESKLALPEPKRLTDFEVQIRLQKIDLIIQARRVDLLDREEKRFWDLYSSRIDRESFNQSDKPSSETEGHSSKNKSME